jgi:hypothetical protein
VGGLICSGRRRIKRKPSVESRRAFANQYITFFILKQFMPYVNGRILKVYSNGGIFLMITTGKNKKSAVEKIDKAINNTAACLSELTMLKREIEKSQVLKKIK